MDSDLVWCLVTMALILVGWCCAAFALGIFGMMTLSLVQWVFS